MQLISTYNIGLRYPLGITINKGDNKLYITAKEGNYIYSLNISNPLLPIIKEISLEPNIPISTNPTLNPYQIILNADESKYYITCTKASELRVLNTSNDSVVEIYSTGSNPTELQLSITNGYLFVSCLGIPTTNRKSSIQVFDTKNKQFIADIYAGHDSKGIAFDPLTNKLFVANRNISAGGPSAHHDPVCDGKNGYITAIDVNLLKLIPSYSAEISVDPYFIGK